MKSLFFFLVKPSTLNNKKEKFQPSKTNIFNFQEQKLSTSKNENKNLQPLRTIIRIFNLQEQTKTFNLQVF
jgi:hypothetical protein